MPELRYSRPNLSRTGPSQRALVLVLELFDTTEQLIGTAKCASQRTTSAFTPLTSDCPGSTIGVVQMEFEADQYPPGREVQVRGTEKSATHFLQSLKGLAMTRK